MKVKVLVAYASKHGATAEIGEKIGEELCKAGLEAEVFSVKRVRDLSQYDAVVIGSSAYIGLFRREAVAFLKSYEKQLKELPVWIFSSGPIDKGDPIELSEGWLFPESLRPVIENIRPRDITCFGGKVDMKDLNLFERFIMKKVKAAAGDYRDWDAIASWAAVIAGSMNSR